MNVIVFALNGCPVSALGPYGNEWIGTPNLDRLASESVVFDRHISDCPEPAAARRAWRSGHHQVPPLPGTAGSSPAARPDLLSLLTSRGVHTVLVNHTRSDLQAEFVVGWAEIVQARPLADEALLRALPAVLDRLTNHPNWLLWVEIDSLQPPWNVLQDVFEAYVEVLEGEDEEPSAERVEPWADPPIGWFDKDDFASWELLHRSFAAVVTVFDIELGRVFDLLRARDLDRTAAWVFTADRGFPLGEHGLIGPHRPWLHEELVQIPLIVRLPGAAEAGRRVSSLTQPADLMPTLLEWFEAAVPPGLDGMSLAPRFRGQLEGVRTHAVSGLQLDGAAECAIRTPEWALLLPAVPHPDDDPREPMLFAKPEDRWEVNNLHSQHVELAEELESQLRRMVGGAQSTP